MRMRRKIMRSELEVQMRGKAVRSGWKMRMRRKAVRSEVEDAKAQKMMRGMERAMFFKEDTTFNDIRDKSLQ